MFKAIHLKRDALICSGLSVITAGIFYFFFINLTFLDPFEKAFKDFSLSDIYYSERLKEEQISNKTISKIYTIEISKAAVLNEAVKKIIKSIIKKS